ncbi:hypothetical protein PINS_up018541 [Pythium insidiosum]|nr:hypothetical protein PINS_up018541 [Pythium insidiosum]
MDAWILDRDGTIIEDSNEDSIEASSFAFDEDAEDDDGVSGVYFSVPSRESFLQDNHIQSES